MLSRSSAWRLYTRPGCHLCEDAEEWLSDLATTCGTALQIVNILDDLVLYEAYKWRIPVLHIGAQIWDAPLDEATVRRALQV